MAELTMVEAVRAALADEMRRDERVLVLGEDVGADGGVFRATEGLIEEFGPDRVMDTPLAESAIAGIAVGLSAEGWRPVAEMQFMGFLYPAIDQIANHAARLRNRTRGRLSCPMVVRAPTGAGIRAPEHHSESFEAMLAHIPGLRVVVPSTPERAYRLLLAAIRDPDPVTFLEPTRLYRAAREAFEPDGEAAALDVARIAREGTELTLVAWGGMVPEALAAADALAAEGVEAEVIDPETLKPLDARAVVASVERTGRCLIAHEAHLTGGFGGEVAARVADGAFASLLAPIRRVAGDDAVLPLPRLEGAYLPNAARIVRAAREMMEYA